MANTTLLEEVWDWITTHPEAHSQDSWAKSRNAKTDVPPAYPLVGHEPSCRTAFCFAGTAVVLAGYALDWQWGSRWDFTYLKRTAQWWAFDAIDDVGSRIDIALLAAKLLGLSDEDAELLFDASNTRDEIRQIINEIEANEANEVGSARVGAIRS